MSEYLYIPNLKHKNTVYLKLNTPIYCIPKNPARHWQTHWSIHFIHRSTVLMSDHRSTHLAIPRFLDLLIHWSTDPPIYSSSDPLIYRSTNRSTNLQIHRSNNLRFYWSIDLQIHRSSDLPQIHRSIQRSGDVLMIHWYLQIHRSSDPSIYRSTHLAIHQTTDLLINWSTDPPLWRSTDLQI